MGRNCPIDAGFSRHAGAKSPQPLWLNLVAKNKRITHTKLSREGGRRCRGTKSGSGRDEEEVAGNEE